MSSCDFIPTAASSQDGKHEYTCANCGHTLWSKYPPRLISKACSQGKPQQLLSPAELAELGDPTLIGNRLEELFSAIGVPPCGGCGKRKDWLNAAHALVRGWLK